MVNYRDSVNSDLVVVKVQVKNPFFLSEDFYLYFRIPHIAEFLSSRRTQGLFTLLTVDEKFVSMTMNMSRENTVIKGNQYSGI